ncbi:MAG: 30S ribosomal protein S2 [Candidatus Collierbacteria bacterium GW2011_GWE2_42_48]|uniref:Small ribosomal subunit protein uS2 n=1 Tax=Candidatus Collierbacteria bacterium GW2011_GWA2_42_17 TaxID=1618378 RepID=A0A0G0Z339_9BACT|nr:MAG: 30S ribosomal protein S2 [Candidatus Collierbacteria bacterium GW2011_GWB2_42_12]KKS43179.1 MAG: 30S ribosomal protein S2 [Candidatus Collierbacteria bacterium GW2011_GWA2_42_17]KKS61663.1 MAG: 30S ribosomal protein S2 [Candidatus Collierbacteria bacterium GW2011_GWE2_42_48]KKS62415.1 MAG: 30S ribosomal protein S2 [Candidatus Collierbacteria bacterium GW2011_GWD2_42_50]KKS63597.1 MAG: 30S ribosomal protein S2 [Candidatus Collierbacteria bacterium GW2011_GWF2_42_51]HAI22717.1 30S riboso
MATKKAETKVVKATPKKEVKKVVKKEVIVEKETATKKAVAKKVVEKVEVKEPKKVASSTIEELFEAGAHFGHVVKKWNPKMKKYLWGAKNGIHIFDLEKTVSGLEDACKALTKAALEGKRIVLVGTKRQAKQMLETEAKRIEVPFITQRWMGGLITNWKQVKLTLERLNSLKLRRDQGQLKKFTKREQVLFDKEIARLERVVGGIATLKDAPEVIVAIDTHKEKLAVKEANNRGALVIGLVDSNANPDMVDYVVPMNDDSAKALEIVIAAFGKALEVGLKERKDLAAAPKANDGSN